jgi:hypothetical protein
VRLGDERGVFLKKNRARSFFYHRVKSRHLARGFSLALLWQEAIRGNHADTPFRLFMGRIRGIVRW